MVLLMAVGSGGAERAVSYPWTKLPEKCVAALIHDGIIEGLNAEVNRSNEEGVGNKLSGQLQAPYWQSKCQCPGTAFEFWSLNVNSDL